MGVVKLFREEFSGMDDECLDRVDRYFEFLGYYDEGLSKEGQRFPIESVLFALSLGLAATPIAERLIAKISRSAALKSSLKRIMQDHPELRGDPRAPEYFQAIADFAPTIAKNPLVAGNMMMQMHRVGPAHITPQLIHTLIEAQSNIERKDTGLGTLADPVANLAEAIQRHKQYMAGEEAYGGGPEAYARQRFWRPEPQ